LHEKEEEKENSRNRVNASVSNSRQKSIRTSKLSMGDDLDAIKLPK